MSQSTDAAVRHRRSLRQVAREEPARRVGVTHNWSQDQRVFHYLDGDEAECDTNIERMRVGTAEGVADTGLGDCLECRNCLRPLRMRAPHEGGYEERPCPLCGAEILVLAKHLPTCPAAGEVEYVR